MSTHPNLAAYRAARDFLLTHRTDLATAQAGFRWPQLTHFNWALDHFDDLARDNHATALWIVADDGSEQKVTFAEMAARSNRVANWLLATLARDSEPEGHQPYTAAEVAAARQQPMADVAAVRQRLVEQARARGMRID